MTKENRRIGVSAVLHGLILGAVLHETRTRVMPIQHPGTREGAHLALLYSPGHATTKVAQAAIKLVDTPLSRHLKIASAEVKPVVAAACSPSMDAGSSQGNNAQGSGNVTLALATYFPWPHPDLSLLPRGAHGDVAVDVTIDGAGRIVATQVAQSMGEAIDSSVLSVVQTWTFKPATEDGVPVPSEQELLFHFEHA